MRGRLEIIADILAAAKEPSTKTSIVYDANLSFEQAQRYLEKCQDEGLLDSQQHSAKKYEITEKGVEYLSAYSELKDKIENKD